MNSCCFRTNSCWSYSRINVIFTSPLELTSRWNNCVISFLTVWKRLQKTNRQWQTHFNLCLMLLVAFTVAASVFLQDPFTDILLIFVTKLQVVATGCFGTEVNRKTSFLERVNFFMGLFCISLLLSCTGGLVTGDLAVFSLLTYTYLLGWELNPNLVWSWQ